MVDSPGGGPHPVPVGRDEGTLSERYIIQPVGPEADPIVVDHWRELWLEGGVLPSQLRENHREITLHFIAEARARLQYQTFVAVDSEHRIVGSASSQRWEAPFPMVATTPLLNLGTVWCIFVRPPHRRRGLGTRLVAACMTHWEAIGCSRGILMYASESGRRIYQKAGFAAGNVLLVDGLRGVIPS
mgnify:CR=1 FL=1